MVVEGPTFDTRELFRTIMKVKQTMLPNPE